MHPANPLQRARNRMWIEFNAALNTLQRNITIAPDAAALEIAVDKLAVEYDKVETWLDDGPFFNGEVFSLVDAAYAPTLMRSAILSREFGVELFNHRPRLAALTEAYLARDSVIHSVVADFAELYRRRMQNEGGWLARTH
jgi:glutathione S-transferase